MVDLARRGFFRGRPRPKAEIRPPWALAEAAFIDACTRCNDCLGACPEAILIAGDGGYPTVDFRRGECTFCGDCARTCQPMALNPETQSSPWPYKAVISPACLPHKGVECRVCGDFCDARAIRFQPRLGGSPLPEIDHEQCSGCGACVAACPTQAIAIQQ
ncbi:ferredoxin-type protein NapF [Dechloromonas denitrificans]|uniref:ferredoxin-type protein NapF n=1 Tax=Dechloromonas denitrificans TaxID=281362 RepID=UPI001CF90EDB|nr:ferredoxin-type protein NapF [Dechloromonas denitrificans]UCV11502.1 ferredoxin-type protein NapF [Dechloromonas denitrificans]